MPKFVDGLKDFLYDSIDYIIMIGIIGIVVFIIGWRLDLLFAKDADDILQDDSIIVEREHDESQSSDPIHEDEEDELDEEDEEEESTEPIVEDDPEPEKPVEPEKPKEPVVDDTNSTTITIDIPAGSSLASIAGILESNKLISSKTDFINKSEEMQLATKVKAGSFKIKSGSSMENILKILTK